MGEAEDVAEREFEEAVRRALDKAQPAVGDGGPPTMPAEAVRQPSMRPDPGLPDPLSGRGTHQPPRQQRPPTPDLQPQRAQPQGSQSARLQPQPPRSAGPAESMPQRPAQQVPPVEYRQPAAPPPQRPSARPQAQPGEPQPHATRAERPQVPEYGAQQRAPQQHRAPEHPAPDQRSSQPRPQQHWAPDQPPVGYTNDVTGDPRHRRPGGPGPGADHRLAVAEQWADPRSPRPQQKGKGKPKGKRKRDAKEAQGNRAREAKWAANRWAVPYFTDGPKVTFGVVWFVLVMGGALLGFNYDNSAVSAVAVAVVTSVAALLAGLQIGFSWFPKNPATRTWTAIAAFLIGVAGFFGPWGVVIGLLLGLLVLTTYLVLYRGHRRSSAQLFDVLVRAAVPVGLASASLGAMAYRNLPVLIALILLVSAYEVGDFLVGSGAFNPVEGPMAGLISAGVVAFFLFLIQPDPFSAETILMFLAVAAVCCVAGQYLASALLPRGNAWAPALRRLDSYLLVAPIWLLLLVLLPDVH